MLSEEEMAINRLECGNTAHSRNADYIQLAIKALKKQIPKEPFYGVIPRDTATNCGNCNSFIGFSDQTNRYNYCPNCGQKLDWSDSN